MEKQIMTMPNKKNKTSRKANLPDSFLGLQEYFMMLRPIQNQVDYKKAMQIAETLAPRNDLTAAQSDYLEILANNIAAYEKKHFKALAGDPLDVLEFLLEENGMNGSDLGRLLGNRSLGFAILSKSRSLSKTHIAKLTKHFAVSPALFFAGIKTGKR